MIKARQAHGITQVGNYIYCCGGFSIIKGCQTLASCERYNLLTHEWTQDVPEMPLPLFSMTLVPINNKWIYSFGGQNEMNVISYTFEVSRLNTNLILETKWESIRIRSNYKIGC